MGSGKKPQNEEEVLGQIFDFIFKEAKKRPDKRKPIKSTGISTSGALADGIAAALEKPGLYVTDQSLRAMNDALTVEFARINADESGDIKAKFTTTNLIEFLNDPGDFLNKPQKAARKSLRDFTKAAFLGRIHQQLQGYAWAEKYNLDLDAKKAIRGHFMAEDIKEKEAARAFSTFAGMQISTSDQDSRKGYIISRASDLVGREMFGRRGWEDMSEERKIGFQDAVLRGDKAVEEYLTKTYTGNSARWGGKAWERYKDLVEDKSLDIHGKNWFNDDGIKFSDIGGYQKLEMRNIAGRIEDLQMYLKSNPNISPIERERIEKGIEQLGQTGVLISGNLSDVGNREKVLMAKNAIQDRIGNFQKEILLARKLGDRSKEKALRHEISGLRKGKRELSSMQFWSTIGTIDGAWSSMKSVWGENGENIISSVLDGSFYDDTSNQFLLTSKRKGSVSFGEYASNIKDENGKSLKIPHSSEIRFLTAVKSNNRLRNAYNSFMTNVYYLTPKSIMNTLFVNGEGFLFAAYKRAEKLGKKIDFGRLAKGDKSYWAELAKEGLSRKEIGRLSVLSKLGNFFSFGQRQRDKVKNWMDDHVFRKLRQKLYNSLVKRIADKEARALLKKWLAKGGFQVLARSIVTSILTAIGIGVTGGLGSFIAPILSALVTDILYDTAKVLIQFVLLIFFGIFGVVFYFGSNAKSNFDSQAYAYTNYAPGEVVSNPNFTGTSPIIGEDDDNNLGDFVAGSLPDGEKCLLGTSSSYTCTQGPYSKGSTPEIHTSHEKVGAIDVVGVDYFYAPAFCGKSNCTITSVSSASCGAGYAGGMVKFSAEYGGSTYEFTLIHVDTTYGSGTQLSAGQAVARVMTVGETTRACSSGTHIHIQSKVNGSVVDPREVLNSSPSDGGFGCNIGECPILFSSW